MILEMNLPEVPCKNPTKYVLSIEIYLCDVFFDLNQINTNKDNNKNKKEPSE
jgi:hypothetical protein